MKTTPILNLTPSEYADKLGKEYAASKSPEFKKQYGQYMTPVKVSNFMAALFSSKTNKNEVKVLDPGAGTAVLGCAAIEYLANSKTPPQSINLIAYEIDLEIIPFLEKSLTYLKEWLQSKKIRFAYQIKSEDFILNNAQALNGNHDLFNEAETLEKFDYIICNPPYFKLSKSDPKAKLALSIIHGQPNIYSIFMAIAAKLLKDDGELVFITPRSFAAGPYFRLFREKFFSSVCLNKVHLFVSRTDAFDKDEVLQENVIIKAVGGDSSDHKDKIVTVTSSMGIKDLDSASSRNVPLKDLIDFDSKNMVLRIPTTDQEDRVVELVHSWKHNLHSLGLQISTGPVVAFRATEYLHDKESNGRKYVPLLWMQNVKAMSAKWPTECRKEQYIEDSERTKKLLVPNKNYVLLRRFSAKEENRRLVAAPYLSELVDAEQIGIENHLNYIYAPKSELTEEETVGLAVLLNSQLLDVYFRTSNGNTQVSATELRDMPLPSMEIIRDIGKHVLRDRVENGRIDKLVEETLVMAA